MRDRLEGDLDNDGEPEALFGLSYTSQSGWGTQTIYARHFMIDFTPRVHLGLTVETAEDPGEEQMPYREGRVRVADVNGDGHGDVVLEGRSCTQRPDLVEDEACRPVARRYLWTARTDGWVITGRAR